MVINVVPLSMIEFIMKMIGIVMDACELIAAEISTLTQGFIPPEAVDEMGILIIFVLVRAGFEFTKKIVEILIVIIAIYVFLQVLPSVLAMF